MFMTKKRRAREQKQSSSNQAAALKWVNEPKNEYLVTFPDGRTQTIEAHDMCTDRVAYVSFSKRTVVFGDSDYNVLYEPHTIVFHEAGLMISRRDNPAKRENVTK